MADESPDSNSARPDRPVVKAPPVLFEKSQEILRQITALCGQPVITYWNSTNGSICANDVLGLYGILQSLGPVSDLTLFIKSSGGHGESSLLMVNLLRQFAGHLTVLAPLECTSAATMLALGANRIQMGPLAHLSAVDTSLTHDLSPIDRDNDRVSVSQDELHRVVRVWKEQHSGEAANPYEALFAHVHPLVIGAVDRASALSTRLCAEILSYHMADLKGAEAISNALNSGYPSHSYPITLREAQRIGLKVEKLDDRLNHLLLELNEVYSEMGQSAKTDFDECNSHDASILNILEGPDSQIFFQNDKDWHYRAEERRWVTMNNNSGWRKARFVDGKAEVSIFHVR